VALSAETIWLPMPCQPNLPVRAAGADDPGPPSEALWTPYPDVSKTYTIDAPALRALEGMSDLPEGTRGWAWETADPPGKVRAWAQQQLTGWTFEQIPGDDGQLFDDIAPPSGPAHACFFPRPDTGVTCLVLMLIPEPPESAAASAAGAQPPPGGDGEAAKRTTCLSNVRQLSVAALMYSMDYDEIFPGPDWAQTTQPYVRNPSILRCPSDDALPSYTLRSDVRGKNLMSFQNPAEEIAIYESDDARTLVARHEGEAVLSYVDGHAKAMPKSSVPLQPGMK
jgi:hypothetical protein